MYRKDFIIYKNVLKRTADETNSEALKYQFIYAPHIKYLLISSIVASGKQLSKHH